MEDGNRTKKAVGLIQQLSFFDMAVSQKGCDIRYILYINLECDTVSHSYFFAFHHRPIQIPSIGEIR